LKEVVQALWRAKWTVLVIATVFAAVAFITAVLSQRRYEASVVLSPISSGPGSQFGGLNAMSSQLGGLAALAGFSVVGDSRKAESIAVLQSQALTERYIEKNDLLPILYSTQWDPARHTWAEKAPTLWDASQFWRKSVAKVSTDTKTGLVTLTVRWTDPNLAAAWANGLVALTNDYLRNKAIADSEKNIAYLNDQAAKTTVVEAKQAIYAILQTEINKLMLARGSDEYAFRVIDPAVSPEKPFSPRPLLWSAASLMLGLFMGVFVVLLRLAWNAS
jgi:uncharacterized protein involved in exopolysaccharide biosynthesis